MRKTPIFILFLTFLAAGLALDACAGTAVQAAAVDAAAGAAAEPAATASPSAAPQSAEMLTEATLPAGLQSITAKNADLIDELAVLQPDFPPYDLISPDGRIGARADLQGIDILEMASGKLLAHITVDLPDCPYGWDRYFSFNQDGSFIAVAARDAIQVWQVGGGIIYENPYSDLTNTDNDTCGAEIPQLALSPDAGLLAVSGVATSSTSAQAYFRVVATLQNQVLYEWDGAQDSLHGDFYAFRGLGFSADGTVLQTFDLSRYNAFSGEEHQAFRFWSLGSWQELARDPEVLSGFQTGDYYYVFQGDDSVQLKSRLDGQVQASLSGTGCTQAYPCDARLSSGAETVALLNSSEDTFTYHREVIATQMSIWDWQSGEQLSQAAIFARNLDGILPSDDGDFASITALPVAEAAVPDWWTSSYNFAGLGSDSDKVIFMPQVLSLSTDAGCYYCGTCSLDPQRLEVTCSDAFITAEGTHMIIQAQAGSITLRGEGENADENNLSLKLPAEYEMGWDFRYVGYSSVYQTAFYCLDEDGRSQVCAIYQGGEREKLTEVEDIYALRFSADGRIAAYINRREKALFLLNLQTGKLTKMDAYQSRAWFVNPAFASTEAEMVYVVQNLNDESILSLEWVDGAEAKVLRRATLDTAVISLPSAVGLGKENGLVALGSEDGAIYLLDQEKGKLLHSWQAGGEAIIGLAFTADDKSLVSLDAQGLIQVWGID